jgi:puromycin-sensitive aminopeptidase
MNEHRLPGAVVPRRYLLSLEPDLDAFTFKGEVRIDFEVRTPTAEITMHAADLAILDARAGAAPLEVRLDPARERVTFVASTPFPAGKASVTVRFTGSLGDAMRGFYRSAFTRPDGTRGYLATTQFEATSARRAFPCFDEPALKASFDVALVVPAGRATLSNMPVAAEEPLSGSRRRVHFATTPVMSTYLLAFVVGEFEAVEGRTRDGVPVRVFATPGRAKLLGFALDVAIRGLEWFDAYYGIPYRAALPKLDLLGVPDFEFGAMENWGAITFRETALFVDPEKSSVPQRRRVAEVVLHELAHQWFGNLVSPEWWSYLWLNESFATYMAYKAADALFPEWTVWNEYLADITAGGKSLDCLRSSHPVEVVVQNPSEVDQIFDAISYNKGGSVLRMLENAVGADVFRDGVRRYLNGHAYGSATTDDLWRALGEAGGQGVPAMMDGWTRRTGHPVIHARRDGAALKLRQERFLLDRDPERPEEDPAVWDVPIASVDASARRAVTRLAAREGAANAPAAWTKLNAGQSGFYLVNYDAAGWSALAKAVGGLDGMDRFGLQEDAYSLMRAGYLPVGSFLELAGSYRDETDHHVWAGLAAALAALSDVFHGEPAVARLEAWARGLVGPAARKIGWSPKPGENDDARLLRATLLGAAVRFADPEAVDEVRRRAKEPASIPPDLRSVVFSGSARHGEDAVLDDLIRHYEAAELPEVRVQLLRAMGAFRRPAPLRRAMAYALSEKVRAQDAMAVFGGTPIDTRRDAWGLLREHWPTLDARYGRSGLIGHFIAASAGGIADDAHAGEVESFFQAHPAPYGTERIRQTLEGIRARAKFRARNRSAFAAHFP